MKTTKTTKTTKTATITNATGDGTQKNLRTEIVFILDRSGSMGGRQQDVIGGFNRMLADQRRNPGECHVSTVLFDDVSEVLHNRVPIGRMAPLTEEQYTVRGCTAYYDALGRAIRHHVLVQRHLPADRRADKVVFVVMTDGYENASQEFDARKLRDIVQTEQDKWGWEFVFLGAGIDAIQAAADIGIAADRAVNFVADSTGIAASFDGVSRAVGNLRARRRLEENEDGTSWRERMDRDFNGRAR